MAPRVVLVAFLLTACGGAPVRAPLAQASGSELEEPSAARRGDLLDAAIPNVCGGPEPTLTIRRGVASYDPGLGPGFEGEVELAVVDRLDLDHDGVHEWIAYVVCRPGGSGTIDGVYAFHDEGGGITLLASIPGGDRADGGLDAGARVEGDEVLVGRYSGTDEGLCCPTAVSEERWALRSGRFERVWAGPPRPLH